MATETITSFDDLIGVLERNPQYRSRLRQSILDEEFQRLPEQVGVLAERTQTLIETTTSLAARMDQLTERMDQLAERMDQLAARMDQLTERMDQLATRMDQLTERMDQLATRMDQLAEHMMHQERRTDSLVGAVAELRFRARAGAYFGHLLRRLRVVDSSTLADLIDDAIDAGTFPEADREPLMRLDLVARGQDRMTREPRYLAIEVSNGLGEGDILRAADRAATLARLTGVPAVPVVAGHSVAPEFRAIADERNVQVVIAEAPR